MVYPSRPYAAGLLCLVLELYKQRHFFQSLVSRLMYLSILPSISSIQIIILPTTANTLLQELESFVGKCHCTKRDTTTKNSIPGCLASYTLVMTLGEVES